MVKAKGNGFIMLGLTDKNLEKLKKGQPIKLNLADMGLPPMEVFIIHGETEEAIYKELKQYFHNDTKIHKILGPNETN